MRTTNTHPEQVLRYRRRTLGFTQRRFAFLLEISPSHLCEIEAGKKIPSLALSVRIEEVSGISPSAWLLAEASPLKPERVQERIL